MFNQHRFVRVATAACGALILSTVTVAAAVAPGSTSATAPAVYAMVVGGSVANV